MKKILILTLIALMATGITPYVQGYEIKYSSQSDLPMVDIWVMKDKDSFSNYLRSKGISEDFIKGLAQSSEYFEKYGPIASTAVLAIPEVGEIASGAIEAGTQIQKVLVVDMPKLFDKIFGGLIDQQRRKDAGIIAYHKVPRGNAGYGAEWNWSSIQSQTGKKRGDTLWIVVTNDEGKQVVYTGTITTDGLFGFIVKKNPAGDYLGAPSAAAAAEATASSEALTDKSIGKSAVNDAKSQVDYLKSELHEAQDTAKKATSKDGAKELASLRKDASSAAKNMTENYDKHIGGIELAPNDFVNQITTVDQLQQAAANAISDYTAQISTKEAQVNTAEEVAK